MLRELLGLILKSDIVIGSDSGLEVLPWFCGNSVISLVPEKHISEGMHNESIKKHLGKSVQLSVDAWLPKSYPKDNKNIILPLEKITPEEVYHHIKKNITIKNKPQSPPAIYKRRSYRSRLWIFFHIVILWKIQRQGGLRKFLESGKTLNHKAKTTKTKKGKISSLCNIFRDALVFNRIDFKSDLY